MDTRYKVPIKNVLYMLSYVWGRAEHENLTEYGAKDDFDGANILVELLMNNFDKIRRAGFYQEYQSRTEEISGVRGKINFTESLRRRSFQNARAVCEFDEFTINNWINQAIKAACLRLWRTRGVSEGSRQRLREALVVLTVVDEVDLNLVRFDRRLNRNNHYNYYILKVCELVRDTTMLAPGGEDYEFVRPSDEQLEKIFEVFVNEFYKKNLSAEYKVGYQERWRWDARGKTEWLPTMNTDTTIYGPEGRNMVIDTKFYRSYMVAGQYGMKFGTGNIYQMFAYLNNFEPSAQLTGVLLYPRPYDDEGVREEYAMPVMNGGEIKQANLQFRTIDLGQDWRGIKRDLLAVVK